MYNCTVCAVDNTLSRCIVLSHMCHVRTVHPKISRMASLLEVEMPLGVGPVEQAPLQPFCHLFLHGLLCSLGDFLMLEKCNYDILSLLPISPLPTTASDDGPLPLESVQTAYTSIRHLSALLMASSMHRSPARRCVMCVSAGAQAFVLQGLEELEHPKYSTAITTTLKSNLKYVEGAARWTNAMPTVAGRVAAKA